MWLAYRSMLEVVGINLPLRHALRWGTEVLFWKDHWTSYGSLKETYPELF